MSSDQLTAFSHVVMTLIGRGGAGAHDLVRMARQGRIYGEFADSQWYAEPKRLSRLGYLEAHREPGKTRERTRYTLTERGVAALQEWMRQPARFSRIQMEPAWRLLAADLVGEDEVLSSLQALRDDIAGLRAMIDLAEAVARTIPTRERYLLLNHRLARRIIDAHAQWLDEVEQALAPQTTSRRRR